MDDNLDDGEQNVRFKNRAQQKKSMITLMLRKKNS